MPICSVIIPSRGRPLGLCKTLHSLTRSTDNPGQVEILVGIDDDDQASVEAVPKFESYPNTTVHIWKRGFLDTLSRLANLAQGKWLFMFNDDATIEGSGWDKLLEAIPTRGVIVQPETHRLNESRYYHDPRSSFPWFPNKCWLEFGYQDFFPYPADTGSYDIVTRHGWKVEFLKGITVFHERKEPSEALV